MVIENLLLQESEASKSLAGQKEEEIKILEHSVEELEHTINVLEKKVTCLLSIIFSEKNSVQCTVEFFYSFLVLAEDNFPCLLSTFSTDEPLNLQMTYDLLVASIIGSFLFLSLFSLT